MKAKELEKLDELGLPNIALIYFSGYETFGEGWNACNKLLLLLEIAAILGVDQRKLALAVGHCINLIRHLLTDQRSIDAIDTLIDFGNGEASLEELRKARIKAHKAHIELSEREGDFIALRSAYVVKLAAAYALFSYAPNAMWFIDSLCEVLGKTPETEKQILDICKQHLTEEVLTKYNQL